VFCLARRHPSVGRTSLDWQIVTFDSPTGRLVATRRLVAAVHAWRPGAIYLRYDLFLPPVPALVRKLPTVVEINADDREEAKIRVERARAASIYNEVNRRLIVGRARGLVCVTRELADSPSFAPYRKPTEVIANGVDLDLLQPLPPVASGRPAVAFLGSMRQVWHGVDKLATFAAESPEIDFHVVGYDERSLRDAVGGPYPANVTAHGPLDRAQFEPVLARCDAAFGTLALHRKNMREACPLKVREYLGYGLPVAIAYDDTDLVDVDAWWLSRIPNTEDNVRTNAERLRAFVHGARGRRVSRDEVADRIGVEGKELRRAAFIERCVAV
jgi:glycosyltransferase involved in cell wall biosynthesis